MGVRPSMEFLRRGFDTIGFSGEFQLGLLDEQHVLIRFSQQSDYHRCWMHGVWKFKKHTMKVLKWTPDFSFDREPPIVSVWVSFDKLPIHFFQKFPLLSLTNLIGKPLKIDAATYNLTRPSVARVCVEINLHKHLPNRIWLGRENSGFWQPVFYEDLPKYCNDCCCLGHTSGNCASDSQLSNSKDKIWRPKKIKTAPRSGLEVANEAKVNATVVPQHQKEIDRTVTSHPNSSGLTASEKGKITVDVHDASLAKKQTEELGPHILVGKGLIGEVFTSQGTGFKAQQIEVDRHPVQYEVGNQVIGTKENSECPEGSVENGNSGSAPVDLVYDDTTPPLAIVPVISESPLPSPTPSPRLSVPEIPCDGTITNMDDESELEEESDTEYEEVIVIDEMGRLKLQLQPVQSDLNTPASSKPMHDVSPVPSAPSPAASLGEDETSKLVSLSAPAIVDSTVDFPPTSSQDATFQDDVPFQQPKNRGRKKKQPLGHETTSRSTKSTKPKVASFNLLSEE